MAGKEKYPFFSNTAFKYSTACFTTSFVSPAADGSTRRAQGPCAVKTYEPAWKLLMSSKANIQFITPLIWDEYKVPLTCGPRPSLHGHVETCPSQIDSRA